MRARYLGRSRLHLSPPIVDCPALLCCHRRGQMSPSLPSPSPLDMRVSWPLGAPAVATILLAFPATCPAPSVRAAWMQAAN